MRTQLMRAAADPLFRDAQLPAWGTRATGVLVETLLDRGTDTEVAEAQTAIDRLAAVPTEPGFVQYELPLLRMRALLAQPSATKRPTGTTAIATVRWRHRGASKDISRGPRRCHDDG